MCKSLGAFQVILCVNQQFCVASIAIFASALLSPVNVQAEARVIRRISIFFLLPFFFFFKFHMQAGGNSHAMG